jgi:glycosyltransferase involved in cell wall biosynthesis
VEIIASPVKLDDTIHKSDYSIKALPVLGWTGTASTLRYLEYILPELQELFREREFILRVIADKPVELPGVKTEFIPWELKDEYKRISGFDIGIMPLSRDPFSEGKAAFKLLQYMACGVPSVCSPVGMNRDVAGNDEFCLTGDTPREFTEKILALIKDRDLREKLGRKGRKLVEEKYSHYVCGEKLAKILLSL